MTDLTPPKGFDILARKVERCHRLTIKQRNKVFTVDEMKIHTLLLWRCQSELSGAERTGLLKLVSHVYIWHVLQPFGFPFYDVSG